MTVATPVTEDMVEAFASKAHYTEHFGWYLELGKVMGSLECGETKARRVHAILIERLKVKYPRGLPDRAKDGAKNPES